MANVGAGSACPIAKPNSQTQTNLHIAKRMANVGAGKPCPYGYGKYGGFE